LPASTLVSGLLTHPVSGPFYLMVIMTYTYNLWIFSVLSFGIIIVPGMDMFFVIANALTGGRARG
jgi:hypothetical protein